LGHYCRDLGLMTMEEGIKKMTSVTAHRLRLWDRGLIREGMTADLVLFNLQTIAAENTYLEPEVYPTGIKAVWVKGELKFSTDL
ncbi:MAG: amidohydrolase family protein, partial [Atribacterota bacterium]